MQGRISDGWRYLFGLVLCLMAITISVSADDQPAPATDETPPPSNLAASQEVIEMRYRRFEASIQQLSEYLRKTDPARAELLVRAIGKSKEDAIPDQLFNLTNLLKKDQLGDAVERQEVVIAELRTLLELLMSEARKDEIEIEKQRIQDLIKDVTKLIGKQTDARADTERGGNSEDLQSRQKQVSDSAEKVVKKIMTQDAAKKAAKGEKPSESADKPESTDDKEGKEGAEGDESKKSDKPSAEGEQPSKDGGEKKDGSEKQNGGEKKSGDDKQKSDKENSDGKKPNSDEKQSPEKSPDKNSDQNSEKKDNEKDDADKKGADKKDSENQSQDGEDGKPSESKDGKQQQGKSQKQKSKPQKSPPKKGKQQEGQQPQDNPDQQQQQNDEQDQSPENEDSQQKQSDKTPGREDIQRAKESMDRAIEDLKKNNRKGASDKQDKALAELIKAKEKLEEILRQVREEEREMVLTQMEARFREMLLKQEAVYNATLAIAAVPEDTRTDRHRSRSIELAHTEEEISLIAAKTLTLLKEEGSSVAFPEAIEQIRDDMLTISRRLGKADVGEITQNIEQDSIEALKEIIEAMQKELEKLKDKRQQGGGEREQQQQQQQQGLVNKLAEMKMLRSLQYRVNRRTKQLGRLVDGEQAVDSDVRNQLKQLSDRQAKVQKATYDLSVGKNQ